MLGYELFINNNLEVLLTLHLGDHPLEGSAQGFPIPKREFYWVFLSARAMQHFSKSENDGTVPS